MQTLIAPPETLPAPVEVDKPEDGPPRGVKPGAPESLPDATPRGSARDLAGFVLNGSLFFLMLGCAAAAWLAQSYYFHTLGDLPDGMSKPFYVLLGGWGMKRILSLTPDRALAIYAGAAAAFGLLAALVQRRALRSSAFQPMLEVGAASPAPRTRLGLGRMALLMFGLLVAAGAFIFCLLFTHASARADNFAAPDAALKGYELFLKHFYRALGWTTRPNAFYPFSAWVGAALSGAAVVALASRLMGLPWSAPRTDGPTHPPRARWEWLVMGAWIAFATLCYVWGSDRFPFMFHQSEGLIGLGAQQLLDKAGPPSVFDNSIQPATCFVHRAPAVAFAGSTLEAQRLTTAVASGTGMIFAFLALRSFVGFLPSFLTLVLFSFCAVTLHYSRTGLDNIEAMYWIMMTLWVFHGAETAAPGEGRFVKYFAAGWAAGGSFGQFTGAPLIAVVIAAMLALRFFFQNRSRRALMVELSLVAAGFAVAFSPFALNLRPVFLRQGDVSIFRSDVLMSIFQSPEAQAHPGASFPMLLLIRTMNAALGFFGQRDTVGEFGSTYPFSGPLLSALAILGASVLVLRFRSWHAVWTVSLYGLGSFFGGAILFGPNPPSSARLLMLAPAVLASAAAALQLLVDCFSSALKSLRLWSGGRRLVPALWMAAGAGIGGWAVGADIYNNVGMYVQICKDPRVLFNYNMRGDTEIYRFLQKYPLFPVRNFEYIHEAEQNYIFNTYLNPNLRVASVTMATGKYPAPQDLRIGDNMFLVQRVDEFKPDLREIMTRFPGGRLTHTEPPPDAADGWRYYIYIYRNLRRPGIGVIQPEPVPPTAAPASTSAPAPAPEPAPEPASQPAPVPMDAPTSPTLPASANP